MAELIYHGHFYQPPRENPWTDTVDREAGATPYSNWNARILAECYRPNAFARILRDDGPIEDVVNNYALTSFNFGPTLLRWIEHHDPATLRRLREADEHSAAHRGGHGNAIAQAYNHLIMPLADERDRATQIRWGLAEFRHRFGRDSEGLWLPETAASTQVLEDMIDHGLRFAILAPWQAGRVRPPEGPWQETPDSSVDTTRPYLFHHRDGSGRTLALFFFDHQLSQSVAFGPSLESSQELTARVLSAAEGREDSALIHIAVDGETAGHHKAWGDLALAYALARSIPEAGLRVTNYGDYLDRHPPTWEAELDEGPLEEGTSWSCHHGVGRWIRDCSCVMDGSRGWNQAWRGPLRAALDLLRDRGRTFFQQQGGELLQDPWAARDDYVQVLLRPGAAARDEFLRQHVAGDLDEAQRARVLGLLEMQHQMQLMYTSCGWFFDDVSGIEATQILRYAAHALDLWLELGGRPPRSEFLEALGQAHSNVADAGTGADVFERRAEASRVSADEIAARVAVSSALAAGPARGSGALYEFEVDAVDALHTEAMPAFEVKIRLTHARTGVVLPRTVVVHDGGGHDVRVDVAGSDPDDPALVWLDPGVVDARTSPARRRQLLQAATDGGVLETAWTLGRIAQVLLEREGFSDAALAAAESALDVAGGGDSGVDVHRLQESWYVAAGMGASVPPRAQRLGHRLGYSDEMLARGVNGRPEPTS